MQQEGITTREQAYKYAALNLKSIDFEMERLKGYENVPLIAGLIERYTKLKEKWEKRLQFTIDNINKPMEK